MNTANEFVSGVLLAGFVIMAVVAVVRTIRHIRRQRRLHHSRSNKRFMRRYRAAHPQSSRTTVEVVSTTLPLPVVRRRTPADAGATPTSPASAGTTCRTTVPIASSTWPTPPVVRRLTPAGAGRTPPDVLVPAGPVPTGRGRHAR